jgi:hypothetical protein
MLSTEQLCSLVRLLGDDVIIHTSDQAAGFDLTGACPVAQFTISEGEY